MFSKQHDNNIFSVINSLKSMHSLSNHDILNQNIEGNNEPNNEPNDEPNNEPNDEPNDESNDEPNDEPNNELNEFDDELYRAIMNRAISSFGLDRTADFLDTFISAYPGKRVISVGSGPGLLEYYYINEYKNGEHIIECVDPDWDSEYKGEIAKPLYPPKYNYVSELIKKDPVEKDNNILILNWCSPNKSRYDYDAIIDLKPMAFFTTLEFWGTTGVGAAGGELFHNFIRTTNEYILVHDIGLQGSNMDIRCQWWQRINQDMVIHNLPRVVQSLQPNYDICTIC